MADKNLPYEDQVTLRMLKTPPKPHAEMKVRKAKASHRKPRAAKKAPAA
jgi:hypothetical protein